MDAADDPRSHWESVYGTKSATDVSWYQREATLSLQLIRKYVAHRSATIVDVGGGASTLVDGLLAHHYSNVTVVDISAAALGIAQTRLGPRASAVRWIAASVLELELPVHSIDLWHDRAVFHFLVEERDRRRYVEGMGRVVRPGGHAIIATFAEDGPTKCSGLPVARYDAAQLARELGEGFSLLETLREDHVTPAGANQSFRYCVFERLGL